MKLTKKEREEITQVYDTWLNSYLNGDVKIYDSFFDDHYHFIGSTENEQYLDRRETTKFLEDTANQLAGKVEIKNNKRILEKYEGLIFVTELFDSYFLIENEWTYYGKFRFTSALKKNKEGWRFVYQHFSTPDSKAQEGETIGTEKIAAENLMLREAVKRRTVELEQKNRELEIEAALERIRSRSMAMQNSLELSEVSTLLFKELAGFCDDVKASGIVLCDREVPEQWMCTYDLKMLPPFHIPKDFDESTHNLYKAWAKGQELFHETISGEVLRRHSEALMNLPEIKSIYANAPDIVIEQPQSQTNYAATFKQGYLLIITENPIKSASLFPRFAKEFEQTYTRFLDLQKAEEQAREVEIQLALERVRARTMAMQKSDELPQAANLLFQQVQSLGMPAWSTGYCVWDKDKKAITLWMSSEGVIQPALRMPLTEDPSLIHFREAHKRGESFYVEEVGGEALVKHYEYLRSLPGVKESLEDIEKAGFPVPTFQIFHLAYFSEGFLLFITYEPVPEAHDIFKRFAKVFEQTYTRFLDLKKAEEQAREAQIETALERVRSASMAMHKTNELGQVVEVLFQQFSELELDFYQVWINIFILEEGISNCWFSPVDGVIKEAYTAVVPLGPFEESSIKSWKTGEEFSYLSWIGLKEVDEIMKSLSEMTGHSSFMQIQEKKRMERVEIADCNHKYGVLAMAKNDDITDGDRSILRRFTNVFEQTYTRFLDLKKVELQAREAQIEAALERVRSRSIGMQKSEELSEVIRIIFEQLVLLDINAEHAGIVVDYRVRKDWSFWVAETQDIPSRITVPYLDNVWDRQFTEAKAKGKEFFTTQLDFEEKNSFYQKLLEYIPGLTKKARDFYFSCPGLAISTVVLKDIGLYIENFSGNPYSEKENDILKRFGKVFQQTYTRFLDLKKAEEQARESMIEASLERVRARTMAMHRSEELADTASVLFNELKKLGIESIRSGVGIIDYEKDTAELWLVTEADGKAEKKILGQINTSIHPLYKKWFDAGRQNKPYFIEEMEGDELRNYYETVSSYWKLPVPKEFNHKEVYHGFFFPEGTINVISPKRLTEVECNTILRFAKVFGLLYRRFLDLQKAEAQAREAIKQASLDRVRGEIASMRTSNDLERITPLIWKELINLNVSFIRCGVFIMDEGQRIIHNYLSTPDGKAIAAFHLPYDTPGFVAKVLKHWQKKKRYLEHWDKVAMADFAHVLVKHGIFSSSDQYLNTLPEEGFYLHLLPFHQGMLYVGNLTQLGKDESNLLQSLANAFSTAYARYDDFNKLELAKKQVDNTLVDLKQAQQQLVQSEKMASLGELTAGIAHEIQNPLNFVNNFSEVNRELIDELKDAVASNDQEEIKLILNDLAENQDKVKHHGKRAEGIVKGMLQHSRTSQGEKEPTDINLLADEYLRLAYHGLRAKDKSFNASFKSDFDKKLPKIKVIPQDIGRVLLNLINNAFYAVSSKASATEDSGYKPEIEVSTKVSPSGGDKGEERIEILVKDNGPGIPDNIKDKIFQPFFTTKPTGQGTGLGLSLSYDIIKAHGGDIKLDTHLSCGGEQAGTEFIISLPVN